MEIYLRSPIHDDIQCFHEIFSDKDTHHFIIDEGLQDFKGSQKKLSKLIEINGHSKLVNTVVKDEMPVGFIVVHLDQTDSPFISYAIRRKFWGLGLASKAISLLKVSVGSQFRSFQAATHLENIPSQKVLRKSQFREIGEKDLPMGKRKLFVLDCEA